MSRALIQVVSLILLFVACVDCKSSVSAEDQTAAPRLTVLWESIARDGKLKSGELVSGNAGEPVRLKVVNRESGSKSFPLCEIESPPISTPSYAIRGRIRYENVDGVGFLEMLSQFAGGEEYFSRTMMTDGAMQSITGSSPEREFELPFHTGGKAPAPNKLKVNLILNGPGTVEIGPLQLVSIEPLPGFGSSESGWWSGQMGGMIGGIGGSIMGIMGSIVGSLIGLGKGKKVVLTLAAVMLVFGVTALVMGIVALIKGQPYEVYYVVLVMGAMTTFFGAFVLGIAPGRFRAHELRRMQALDV